MDWKVFLLRVAVALVLGALIGAERQLRQRLTGLRTNALVSTGACLFVLMTQGVPGLAGDASRIATVRHVRRGSGRGFCWTSSPDGPVAID